MTNVPRWLLTVALATWLLSQPFGAILRGLLGLAVLWITGWALFWGFLILLAVL